MRSILDPPPREARARFDRSFGQRFLLTVDTEEEFDWDQPLAREGHGLDHVHRLEKFQTFCESESVVPVYLIFNGFGLTRGLGQYVSVILMSAIVGTSIFLLRQYFLSIPRDLEEAARMDGAGFFTTFLRVMLPLAGPALSAVAILQFQGTWNGFFWPTVFLQDPNHYTVQIGLNFFRQSGGFSTNWPPLMAVIVMATIPILVLYIFFQRYFVEGIAASGVKG